MCSADSGAAMRPMWPEHGAVAEQRALMSRHLIYGLKDSPRLLMLGGSLAGAGMANPGAGNELREGQPHTQAEGQSSF